jgi:hypothetical protein
MATMSDVFIGSGMATHARVLQCKHNEEIQYEFTTNKRTVMLFAFPRSEDLLRWSREGDSAAYELVCLKLEAAVDGIFYTLDDDPVVKTLIRMLTVDPNLVLICILTGGLNRAMMLYAAQAYNINISREECNLLRRDLQKFFPRQEETPSQA